jgi:hypothetical protein
MPEIQDTGASPVVCAGFANGCTCGDCQVRYFTNHGNSCSLGRPTGAPRELVKLHDSEIPGLPDLGDQDVWPTLG